MASGVLLGTDMVKTRFIERTVKDLTDGYMIADALFMRDPSDTPSISYEENPNGLNNDEKSGEVEQRTEGGSYPRIGLTAEAKQALIKDWGLSAVISYEAVRFNKISSINRSYITLSNSVVKFVDSRGLNALTDSYNAASTKINTLSVANAWSTSTGDPFADLMRAAEKVNTAGYLANTAVVSYADWTNALVNKNFREMLDTDVPPERKIARKGVLVGQAAGLTILASRNLTAGNFAVCQDQVLGNRSETNNGVEIDSYKQGQSKKADQIVDAFREVEFYLTDPKAVTLATGN